VKNIERIEDSSASRAQSSALWMMTLRNAPEALRISATIALIDSQQREMDDRSRPRTMWRSYLEDDE
jgi:hypothetical protein